jgi:uncharacterized protein
MSRQVLGFMAMLLSLCASALQAGAGPLEDAATAYSRKDYDQVYEILRPVADAGNAEAQNRLGNMYFFGIGVPQDYAKAIDQYRKAAVQGHPEAQATLGRQLGRGLGVPRDDFSALIWVQRSAEQGNLNGQLLLSGAYHYGYGTKPDLALAYKWALLAVATAPMYLVDLQAVERDATEEEKTLGRKLALEFRPRPERQ